MNNLTDRQLTLLALIHFGYNRYRPLAQAAGYNSHAKVWWMVRRLIQSGYIRKYPAGKQLALTLTEQGREAVRCMALIQENGSVRIGRVERV